MTPKTFILRNESIVARLIEFLQQIPLDEKNPIAVKITEISRTLEQNAAQWPILDAVAAQLEWPVNGAMVKLQPEEWKDILTAGFKGERVRLAQGVNGGVVMLGLRTSQMGKKEFAEWLEYLNWFCAERGVDLDYIRIAA